MTVRYDMSAVRNAVKRIAREQLRKAVGGGQDSPSIRLAFTGMLPSSIPAEPKFQIKWEITATPDGDFLGRLLWTLLGYSGNYPVCVEYIGDVPPTAEPTYFSDPELAARHATDCATRLREQFAQMFESDE